MPSVSWCSENEFRDYPFLDRVTPRAGGGPFPPALPQTAIVDFGAILGSGTIYSPDQHVVYLHQISRASDVFTFVFRTTAEGPAADDELRFTRRLDDPPYLTEWTDSTRIDMVPRTEGEMSPWRGFLVTGHLDDLATILPSGETLDYSDAYWRIEPTRIQMLAYLQRIHIGNLERVMAIPPPQCATEPYNEERRVRYVGTVTGGDVQFEEGFNCTIIVSAVSNTISIGGGVGSGLGRPTEQVRRYPGEEPPDDSPYLEGGPSCEWIIQSINGVASRKFRFVAGPGFSITPDTSQPYTIQLTVDTSVLAKCE